MSQIPMLVLIDFDQTITINDTIASLGQFGVSQTHNSKPWSYFVDSYLQEYRHHRDHLPKVTDFKAFIQQLDSYRPIEQASLSRISNHKVFQGISRQAFIQQGIKLSQIELQPNVISTLKAHKENIRIVSLNWSKDWILGFTKDVGLKPEQIYCNDLTFENDICTGEIIPHILTAGDKQRIIKSSITTTEKIIYIGDSLGDIEALGNPNKILYSHSINTLYIVESDIGIIIGKDNSLIQSLNHFGYSVQDDITKPSHLYRIDHWDQIKTILDTQ